MALATLSSQNQITLPKRILDEVQLCPRDKVFVHKRGSRIILEPINQSIAENTFGALSDYVTADKKGQPLAEIMQETKKKAAQKLNQATNN